MNYQEKTDKGLIDLYLSGDIKALGVLISKYKDKLYTSIYLWIKDKNLSEDILQNVFIKIIEEINWGKYTDQNRFYPWMARIAHNMCVDHFRSKKAKASRDKIHDPYYFFEKTSASHLNIEDKISNDETYEKIRSLIDLLPDEQREVVILRHYADLPFRDIADLTNCSINTALGRMRYGLINLRKMVSENNIVL
jgi:RNA polymerase sigma-70 factor (ECF subfamily)